MNNPTPAFLLASPEIVTPAAPWCVWLDNLELGCLLLAQPWLAGGGALRADLERQLAGLGASLPVGPVYFQRVNRAVALMEARGQLRAEGEGRSRRFVLTPEGFAALVLNLQVLRADPTLEGGEFELKRTLVAMWSLILERLSDCSEHLSLATEIEEFFAAVERIEVFGRHVITDEVVADGFNVLRLVATQREQIEAAIARTEEQHERASDRTRLLRGVELRGFVAGSGAGAGAEEEDLVRMLAFVRSLAASEIPRLVQAASLHRYRAYLRYLDALTRLYSRELKVVEISSLRQAAARRAR